MNPPSAPQPQRIANPARPSRTIAPETKDPKSARGGSPHQWKLAHLRDTRENVLAAVQSAAFVPEAAKVLLLDLINAVDPGKNLISVNAHSHHVNGMFTVNITVKPL